MKHKLPIIITMGDPAGIGPEVILRSFTSSAVNQLPIVVYGDFSIMELFKQQLQIDSFTLERISSLEEFRFNEQILHVLDFDVVDMATYQMGQLSATCGEAAYQYIVGAIQSVKDSTARGVVTAPINKEALHLAGHLYPGHTEIFAEFTGSNDYAMLLYDDQLSVIHVSTHVALSEAIERVTATRLEQVIELAAINIEKIKGRPAKIAVAGLNPHASENGLFGDKERLVIEPVIHKLKHKFNVIGPVSPDSVFARGLKKEYDIVVAMYHDQGHIPFKLYAFDSGVNTSVGLPITRTSVDHGTAFDIAGKGIANFNSMIAAILLNDKLSS